MECKWCRRTKWLCKSHLVARWQTEQAWKGDGRRFYELGPEGPKLTQKAPTQYLLCKECEDRFGKTERDAALNIQRVTKSVVIDQYGSWERKPSLAEQSRWEQWNDYRGPRGERWEGLNAAIWRKLAWINTWRTAVSRYCGKESWQEEEKWLRACIEKNSVQAAGGEVYASAMRWNEGYEKGQERAKNSLFVLPHRTRRRHGQMFIIHVVNGITLWVAEGKARFPEPGRVDEGHPLYLVEMEVAEGNLRKGLEGFIQKIGPMHDLLRQK